MKRSVKKYVAVLVLIAILSTTIGNTAYAIAESIEPLVVSNDFIEYTVNRDDARFSIRTSEGSPWRDNDSNKQLLYQNKIPETSFTTFKIDGEDYIYGNSYGFLGGDGNFISNVSNNGYVNQSTWKMKGVEITQQLQLYEDKSNPYVGNVKITYTIKNTNAAKTEIGTRILLDTMLGANDASPVVLNGQSQFINLETDLKGKNVPEYWRASDDPLAPKVLSYGFLDGWGNKKPDRMIIGHWDGLSESKWDYAVDSGLNFTTSKNSYKSADSAVALYWQPVSVGPGEEIICETFYGLGNFYTTQEEANYGLQVFAPEKLTLNGSKDGYNEETFNISVEIDNSIMDAKQLTNMEISLGITDGLELDAADEEIKTIDTLNTGEIRTVSWTVKAQPQDIFKVSQYVVTVTADGLQDEVRGGYTILPALSGEPPQVQLLSITPNKVYYEEDEKNITLNGKGFEMLKASNDWDVKVKRNRDQKSKIIPQSCITVSDDNNIKIVTDNNYWDESFSNESGGYTIILDADQYGTFTKNLILTKDKAYISRAYGVLLVIGKNISSQRSGDFETGDEIYEIVTASDDYDKESYEAVLNANSQYYRDNQVLLEFKGDIKEYITDNGKQYYIQPGCYINSVIEYGTNDVLKFLYGEASQNIIIKEDIGDNGNKQGINISGSGMLSIPGFPFVQGNFKIELDNGTRYSLDADDDNDEASIEVNWDVMEGLKYLSYVGIFPVKIKNAVIGDKSVSFGGSAYLNLGGNIYSSKDDDNNNNDTSDDEDIKDYDDKFSDSAAIGLAINELKFGYRNSSSLFGPANEYGFIGINAEGKAGMPDNMIPGLDFGAEGSVLVNTLDNIYTVDIEVKFAVVEFKGLISLRFIDGTYPIPDSIVGYVGGEPGIPIIPVAPVVYITGGGLGFENLYDTVTLNFERLPPLKLMFTGSAQVLKVFEGNEITLAVSPRGVKLSGDLTILKLDLFKDIHGEMEFGDGEGIYIEFGGGINVFDTLVGEVSIGGGYDESYSGVLGPIILYGKGKVAVQVPGCVPVVGGKELLGAEAEISTKHIFATAAFLDIPVAVEYVWGDTAPTVIADASGLPRSSLKGIAQQTFYNEETGEAEGTMIFGSNIKRIAASKYMFAYDGDISSFMYEKPIITAGLDNTYNITIDNRDAVIFEVSYDGDIPELEVYKPDGSPYELVEDKNYTVQVISAEESQSGFEEKRVGITAVNPENGDWTIKSDKDVNVALLDVTIPPSLDSLSVESVGDDHTFKASWQASHVNDEKIALYLCEEEGDIGRKIIDDINVNAGTYTYTLPDSTASGSYYIRAVLYNDDTNYDSITGEDPITVIDEYQPLAPESIQVESSGNGAFKVSWDQEGNVDGYYIEIKDENGNALEGVGAVEIEGDMKEVYVGGTYRDTDGNLMGMVPGENYMVSMVSYKKVNEVTHYSNEVLSQPIYLPDPQPPELAFDIRTDEGDVKVSQSTSGKYIYTVNQSEINLFIESDQQVEAQIILNDELLVTAEGKEINKKIDLEEGENLIQVNATNDNGDTSIYGVTVRCDTTAPELKVDEIETVYIDGEEKIKIRGIAELGSTVSVNKEAVEVDDEGIFETYLSMKNEMKKDINITAEDQAGNITTYNSKIYNEDISDLDRVEIRSDNMENAGDEENENSASLEGYIGKTVELELHCIDNQDNEYLLDSEDVQWDILAGEGVGDISETGVLSLKQEGDIIVKASYYVSDEYAFEDALIVSAIENTQGDDPSSGDTDGEDFTPIPEKNDKKSSSRSSIDRQLENILKNLIGNEKNMSVLKKEWITGEVNITVKGDENMSITIPRQNLENKIGLGIWKINDTSEYKKGNIEFLSDIYEIILDQNGLLEKSAILEISYDPDKVDNPEELAIYWFNEEKNRWEYVGGEVDKKNHTVTVILNHFSKYCLIYNSDLRRFEDIEGRWSKDIIYSLASLGIINGVEKRDGFYYEPERHITRQEFVKLLIEASGIETASSATLQGYSDSESIQEWAIPYMKEAVSKNLVTGIREADGVYMKPLRDITRAEVAVIAGRVLKIQNKNNEITAFTDDNDIPGWAKSYVKMLNEKSIITGYLDNTFRSYNPITREEAATIILKLIEELE